MPKKSIALALACILTLAPVSGVFGSIMDKINSYRVFVPNTNAFLSKRNPLWFSVKDDNGQQCEEEADYATAVYQEAIPIFGQDQATYALGMFGKIGVFDAKLPGYDEFFITNEPSEYYFTDMVFIQQKYEEALVDLYFFRAESAWTQFDNNKRPAVDEAIAGTYWVAQQNGVSYTEEQIQAKFLEQLDAQLEPLKITFINSFKKDVPRIDQYTNDFVNALRNYYLNPCLETFENTIQVAFDIEDKVDENWFSWELFFTRITRNISSGL